MTLDVLVTGTRREAAREVVAHLLDRPAVEVRAGSSRAAGSAEDERHHPQRRGPEPAVRRCWPRVDRRVRVVAVTGRRPRAMAEFVRAHVDEWRT